MSEETLNCLPKEHDLEIWKRHFEDVLSGKKKAEHRVNDRDFQVGDTLLLREVTEPKHEYTGRKLYVAVTHIIRGGEMDILSIEPQNTCARSEIPVIKDDKAISLAKRIKNAHAFIRTSDEESAFIKRMDDLIAMIENPPYLKREFRPLSELPDPINPCLCGAKDLQYCTLNSPPPTNCYLRDKKERNEP